MEEVFGACGEDEGVRSGASGGDGRFDTGDGLVEGVDGVGRVCGGILDGAAAETGGNGGLDGRGAVFGSGTVAVFEVGGDGKGGLRR